MQSSDNSQSDPSTQHIENEAIDKHNKEDSVNGKPTYVAKQNLANAELSSEDYIIVLDCVS